MNRCLGCGKDFKSVGGFDEHRVFDNPKKEDWRTRRCLTDAELRQLGFEPNASGVWRRPMSAEDVALVSTFQKIGGATI